MYRELYILFEGDDDQRFVEKIIKPRLQKTYDYIGLYQYAQRSKVKVENFLQSVIAKKSDYFCLVDIDQHPCVTKRKAHIKSTKFGPVPDTNIFVVKKEIEGWYLAGLNESRCKELRLNVPKHTNFIGKQGFEDLLSQSKLGCSTVCKIEILNKFDLEIAKTKNHSFNYFCNKHLP